MTDYKFPLFLGVSLGSLHGLILWAAIQTLTSLYLYPRYVYQFATQIALAVDVVIVITIVSAVWWLPRLERFVDDWNTPSGDASDDL